MKHHKHYNFNKLSDTSPSAENIQISLIRKADIPKRFECLRALSKTTIFLSKRAIMRAHPDWNEKKINIAFVRYHYGNTLANKLENYLNEKSRHNNSLNTCNPSL